MSRNLLLIILIGAVAVSEGRGRGGRRGKHKWSMWDIFKSTPPPEKPIHPHHGVNRTDWVKPEREWHNIHPHHGVNRTDWVKPEREWHNGTTANVTEFCKKKFMKDHRPKRGNLRSFVKASGDVDELCTKTHTDNLADVMEKRICRKRCRRKRITCEAGSVAYAITLEFESGADNQTEVGEVMASVVSELAQALADMPAASDLVGLSVEETPEIDVEVHDQDDYDILLDEEYDMEFGWEAEHQEYQEAIVTAWVVSASTGTFVMVLILLVVVSIIMKRRHRQKIIESGKVIEVSTASQQDVSMTVDTKA